MSKLFLTSDFSGVAKLFPDFAGSCAGKRVVFIPTASLHERFTFYIKADLKALGKLGVTVDELEISTASRDEIKGKLSNADFIFAEGGNTFFLLQELKRTGADKLITEQVNGGKLYIGASAGSVIAAPDIEYLKIMDNSTAAPGLDSDFSALSLVDFFIVPHQANFPFKKIVERIITAYSAKLDLRPISNHQAITVDNGKVEQIEIRKK